MGQRSLVGNKRYQAKWPKTPTGRLDALARDMFQRLVIIGVGHSPSAWMERNITVAAMLLDHRSRQLGCRLRSERSWAEHEVESSMQSHLESATPKTVFRPLNNVETSAAASSLVFALEWQRYLNKLFIRPPGEPLGIESVPFPQYHAPPSDEISMKIAELATVVPLACFAQAIYPTIGTGSEDVKNADKQQSARIVMQEMFQGSFNA